MRSELADLSPATRSAKPRYVLRISGLCALIGAVLVAGAVSPTKGQPSGGRIVAATLQAPVLGVGGDPLIAGTVDVARPAAASTRPPGYVLMAGRLTGETPFGLSVWVDSRAPHRARIATRAHQAVAELSRLGLHVRWRGYGHPKAGQGVVQISENQSGCQGGSNVVGMTWPYWMALPNGDLYTYRANIALCPRLFTNYGSWQWSATVRHELGHAVGLGHSNYVFGGSYQVMNAATHYGVTTYRAGDVKGLRRLAAANVRIRQEYAPAGRLDRSYWMQSNRIAFAGWSLLTFYKTRGVRITLTDNGRVIARRSTSVLRADVNRRLDPGHRAHGFSFSTPWPGGRHTYCLTATSSVNRVAVAKLGCVSWNG